MTDMNKMRVVDMMMWRIFFYFEFILYLTRRDGCKFFIKSIGAIEPSYNLMVFCAASCEKCLCIYPNVPHIPRYNKKTKIVIMIYENPRPFLNGMKCCVNEILSASS